MKKMLPIALSLLVTSAAFAQLPRCTVTVNDRPSVFGFKLGSSFAEIQRDFPQIEKSKTGVFVGVASATVKTDEARFLLNFDKNDSISFLQATFNKMEDPDMRAFTDYLKASIDLPGADWHISRGDMRLVNINVEVQRLDHISRNLARQHGKDDSLVKEVDAKIADLRSKYSEIEKVVGIVVIGCPGFKLNASLKPDGVPELLIFVDQPKPASQEAASAPVPKQDN